MQLPSPVVASKTLAVLALAVTGVIGCDDTDTGSRGVTQKTRAAVANISGLKSLEPSADLKVVTESLTKAADTDAGPAARAVAASTAAQVGLQSATAAANKLNAQADEVRRTLAEIRRLAGLVAGNSISAKGYTAGDHKTVIANLSDQIAKMQGNAQAATWGEPSTLPTLAAAKQEAARLQGEIDAKQQQLDALNKKRSDALTKAEAQSKHAEGLKGEEAVRAYGDASQSKKEADDAAIDIDLVSVQLDRLKADLAAVQSQEKIVDAGIATLNNEGKLLETNWRGRNTFATKQADLAKLVVEGDAKKSTAPSIKSLAVQLQQQLQAVAETRQAAFEQLTEAAKYAGQAKSEAEKLQNSVREKMGGSGKEAQTYKALVDVVHPQKFQYEVALAERDTGILSVGGTSLLNEVKAGVDAVKGVISSAGLTVPEELEKIDFSAATTLATEAAEKLKASVETFNNVESGNSPEGIKTAAKGAHLIALFAHLNLLDVRKAAGDTAAEADRNALHSAAIGLRDELANISKDAVPALPGELGTPPATPTAPGSEASPATAPATAPAFGAKPTPPSEPATPTEATAAGGTIDVAKIAGRYQGEVNDAAERTIVVELAADGTGTMNVAVFNNAGQPPSGKKAPLTWKVAGAQLAIRFEQALPPITDNGIEFTLGVKPDGSELTFTIPGTTAPVTLDRTN